MTPALSIFFFIAEYIAILGAVAILCVALANEGW